MSGDNQMNKQNFRTKNSYINLHEFYLYTIHSELGNHLKWMKKTNPIIFRFVASIQVQYAAASRWPINSMFQFFPRFLQFTNNLKRSIQISLATSMVNWIRAHTHTHTHIFTLCAAHFSSNMIMFMRMEKVKSNLRWQITCGLKIANTHKKK